MTTRLQLKHVIVATLFRLLSAMRNHHRFDCHSQDPVWFYLQSDAISTK
ncbi:hypothetical protein GcM1_c1138o58 [Golovinomyces cichoracearum]|uniref:Uncharacterized protein n=1 Tax=Golovinomyces cichoracearum TaxID=62708 RepID=A0A420IBF2_9PEZI|nr:hypothetical protein GcM1_c1138o58 [Golovinomyces cichoracearum]